MSEHEERYREVLNEVYGTVNICGLEYDAAEALEAIDPIAYRCDMADFDCGACKDCIEEEEEE